MTQIVPKLCKLLSDISIHSLKFFIILLHILDPLQKHESKVF